MRPRNESYWAKVNAQHRDCNPSRCHNQVDHSRYRINEFAFRLQADELTAEIEQALTSGEMPRRPRSDPGE